jgi:hypothetical protein
VDRLPVARLAIGLGLRVSTSADDVRLGMRRESRSAAASPVIGVDRVKTAARTQDVVLDSIPALKILKPETVRRAVQAVGRIVPNPRLGGLHHQYVRI